MLEAIHLRSRVGGQSTFTAPWGIHVGNRPGAFYVITRGHCWLELDRGNAPIALTSGDLVVIPHGQSHSLRDSPRSPVVPVESLLNPERIRQRLGLVYGGGGAMTRLVRGGLRYECRGYSPLLAALPPVIHVKGEDGRGVPWLAEVLRFIAEESAADRPGMPVVISHLAEILFIQAVRAFIAGRPAEQAGWLGAMLDPEISPALVLMHARPEQAWSVASLAEEAGLSRSAFAARFTAAWASRPCSTCFSAGCTRRATCCGRAATP